MITYKFTAHNEVNHIFKGELTEDMDYVEVPLRLLISMPDVLTIGTNRLQDRIEGAINKAVRELNQEFS